MARLSGATSEFLSMVYYLFFGPKLFEETGENPGAVVFTPEPRLPKEWFSKKESGSIPKDAAGVRLFGVPVTYVNPERRSTFGSGAVKAVEYEWILDGRYYKHRGKHLTPEASAALREGRLERLTILLG
ncbi:MAG: hypothetical protein JO102_05525 [Elusimicrobia bacterium]|nr:hypothetical protein [Elusimicrobiota bacterium]